MPEYRDKAYEPGIKEQAINGRGIRDMARVLHLNKNTVISPFKKKENIIAQVNPNFLMTNSNHDLEVRLEWVCEEAEIDEQWSFVGNKSNQRWLGYAVDHGTNTVLAYVFGKRNTQKIERKNLNYRTWIKQLTRKTICFSTLESMHDIVIGLLINKVEFEVDIHVKSQV